MIRKPVRLAFLLLLTVAVLPAGAGAQEEKTAEPVFTTVDDVLVLGPSPAPLPAFADSSPGRYDLKALVDAMPIPLAGLRPRAGAALALPGRADVEWRPRRTETGRLELEPPSKGPAEVYLACYLTADRWQEATLRIDSAHPVTAYLDGVKLALEPAAEEGAEPPANRRQSAKLELARGRWPIVVRGVRDPAVEEPWRITLELGRDPELPATALASGVDSRRGVTIHDVLDAPRVESAVLSPDGELAAVLLATYPPGGAGRETWLEIRRARDGGSVASWRGIGEIRQIAWAPLPVQRLTFVTEEDEASTLWLADLASGRTNALLRQVKNWQGYRWAPDGRFVVYAVREPVEPDERRVKRVRGPADRQPHWRDRLYLMQASVPDGVVRRLTAGPLAPEAWRIAPDGERLLFFLSEPRLAERPYFSSELWELQLATLEARRLLDDRWIASAEYAPDGRRLVLRGSPSAFDGLGRNVPDEVQVNDYGGQLYLFDPGTGDARPLTRDFDPDVNAVWWSPADGRIYALATNRQDRNLFALEPDDTRDGTPDWRAVPTGLEYTDDAAFARDERVALVWGSSAAQPPRLQALDLAHGRARPLLDPGTTWYHDVGFGEVSDWPCSLPSGEVLDGRIYYPADFDPQQRYPLIVYYYGGTVPVTRDYGGRYPKNVWAAHGYVVYVPEPSGATGYGQEFAARHVNDWGRITAREVIAATKAFLATHAFVDPERVGCIGASYGGFLTELIVTETDLFTCAISHAGISSISSYWGEGLWGYVYGARALAGSFPWQDRELYVEQSPLFHADRITTPLLLLHGTADTNVPMGESDQLFTALRLLGRDVEYVQIVGQNHHILDHDQRIVWNDTILAYFAKYLKRQPAWWNHLYPKESE